MSSLLIVGAAIFGLVIGAFLNLVITRILAQQPLAHRRPAWPSCGALIRRRDNAPVFSWGRCRACRAGVSVRHPAVEALTAGLFVEVALRFGWSWSLPGEWAFVAGLVALSACDLDQLILPKRIVYPTGLLVLAGLFLAAAVQGGWHRMGVAAACAAVELVVLYSIHLLSPRAMGFGDVRLAPVIGLALGWLGVRHAVVGFFVANLVGAVVGLLLLAAGRATRKTAVPYGVFLAAGAVLTIPLK